MTTLAFAHTSLTVLDPNRKVPDLYFKVTDPKLQVAHLKSEVEGGG